MDTGASVHIIQDIELRQRSLFFPFFVGRCEKAEKDFALKVVLAFFVTVTPKKMKKKRERRMALAVGVQIVIRADKKKSNITEYRLF